MSDFIDLYPELTRLYKLMCDIKENTDGTYTVMIESEPRKTFKRFGSAVKYIEKLCGLA